MSNNDDSDNYFGIGSNFDSDKIRVEIPSEREPMYQQRIPSGYDPMGEIYLRGRAMRNLSSGTMPWWVLWHRFLVQITTTGFVTNGEWSLWSINRS